LDGQGFDSIIFDCDGVLIDITESYDRTIDRTCRYVLKEFADEMVMLMHTSIENVMAVMGESMMVVFWKIFWVLLILALIDYFYTRYQWFRKNNMTKDEVKDEKKAIEGDEKTKRQIMAKGLQRSAQSIHQSVPQADVVVVNPNGAFCSVEFQYDITVSDRKAEVCERLCTVIEMHKDTAGLFDSCTLCCTVIESTDSVHLTNEITEEIDAVWTEIHEAPASPLFRLCTPFVW